MALLTGFLLVMLLGVFHHFSLRWLDLVTGSARDKPNWTIFLVFNGLLSIHTVEIMLFAVAYRLLLSWHWLGDFTIPYDGSWYDLIYFSGVNFVTLGYTQIDTQGPIKLVNMMQSLGGFMVLTWSATFIYSAWGRAFRE
jgi:hypothetical protein